MSEGADPQEPDSEYSRKYLFTHLKSMFDETYISSDDVKNIVEKYKEKGDIIRWNKEHEGILVELAEKCNVYTWYHRKSSNYLHQRDSAFIYSLIGLNSMTSLCILLGTNYSEVVDAQHLVMLSGGVNFITGLVTAIYKKINIGASVDSHMFASKMFRKLANNIYQQLALPDNERDKMPKYLQECTLEYDTLILESPIIPEYIINDPNAIRRLDEHPDINVPVEIRGGFKKVYVYEGAKKIKRHTKQLEDTAEKSVEDDIESQTPKILTLETDEEDTNDTKSIEGAEEIKDEIKDDDEDEADEGDGEDEDEDDGEDEDDDGGDGGDTSTVEDNDSTEEDKSSDEGDKPQPSP